MRNLHALLGVQQGFRHELPTNHAFLINLKTKKVVIIDAHMIMMVVIEFRLSATIDLELLTDT